MQQANKRHSSSALQPSGHDLKPFVGQCYTDITTSSRYRSGLGMTAFSNNLCNNRTIQFLHQSSKVEKSEPFSKVNKFSYVKHPRTIEIAIPDTMDLKRDSMCMRLHASTAETIN